MLTLWLLVLRRRPESEGQDMRARCDPIDTEATLRALAEQGCGLIGPSRDAGALRRLYADYASVAARPYARATWEGMLRTAERKGGGVGGKAGENGSYVNGLHVNEKLGAAAQDEASDTHWAERLQIKPRVLTTVADNASLRVKGGALIVCDGNKRLVYETSARRPQAIVMTGWSGLVSIEAMRWACDHKVAIVVLDWMRDFLTIVAPSAKTNAALVRAQVCADPTTVARFIVAVKIATHVRVGALSNELATPFLGNTAAARSVRAVMVQEAQAARVVWPNVPLIRWRVGSPRVPASWKLPYSLRRRADGISPRNATHPVNALLNVALSVAAGRITAQLAACGFAPAIGFLHSDKAGRWSLAYDAIEPLRPLIEQRVFAFIRKHQFGSNDFIQTSGGTIRLNDNLLRVVIAETALPARTMTAAVDWIAGLLLLKPGHSKARLLTTPYLPGF
jgi:CRISP-associated protein Cas1